MSRIGIKPISIVEGVTVKETDGVIVVSNGKNELEINIPKELLVKIAPESITVEPREKTKEANALHGTVRMLINNAVYGLSTGWKKVLEFHGSGYRAQVNGNELEMHLGYSHPIIYQIPEGVEVSVVKNSINITGYDKQQVGQVAANIRDYRKPEPYKGKGIRYKDEHIVRKVGKALKSTA